MKRIVLLGLLALGACSKPAEAPPPEPVQTVAAPVSDSWTGKYEGDLRVTIAPDNKVMLIEAAPDGCTGDIGLADGGLVSNAVSESERQIILHPDAAATCTLTLHKTGAVLTIRESEGCAAYHGATCSFNGTASRLK